MDAASAWTGWALSMIAAFAAVGCGNEAAEGDEFAGSDAAVVGDSDAGMLPGDCTPDEAEYEQTVRPILEDRCGSCHGAEPDFGAPYTLLDYASLMEPDAMGRSKPARMLHELSEGTMPPSGNARPTEEEFDTLTQWASCGEGDYAYPSSLKGSREVLQGPDSAPEGTTELEMLADEFTVPDKEDHYQEFFFEGVVDEDKFVRRFEVRVDESAVVHHITLQYADSMNYLYAWAPGTGPVQFPDGGLRIGPEERFRLEVHYNNPRGLTDVEDSSGMVLYIAEPEGTEYAMLDPNTFNIFVPPQSKATATSHCTVENDFTIFAGFPHMHEIGSAFEHSIERQDGTTEMLIELEGWSFDQQYFYEMGVDVQAGDEMTLTCEYANPTDKQVVGGLGTADEMCYNFMYVTPPEASLNCPDAF